MSAPFLPESLRQCLLDALEDAQRRRHEHVTLEHLMFALINEKRAGEILQACGTDLKILRQDLGIFLDENVEQLPEGLDLEPEQTMGMRRVLSRAIWHAQAAEQEQLESGDVLAALFEEPDSYARYLLEQQGVTRLDVLNYISHGVSRHDVGGRDIDPEMVSHGEEAEERVRDPLEAFTTNLVEMAAADKIDPMIGRESEMERTVQILCRRLKNNPLFVGDPGVGKTAMA
ncbi:MAG: ATP-dependent Clp protease ATP-binding subunit ClpA, partial [Chloroflexi bacterium]|nr:ATP-dependent Clp protease ATP-binding subunit ClpA [Chloroflexota bacterium]